MNSPKPDKLDPNQLERSICLGEECKYWLAEHNCIGCTLIHDTVDSSRLQGGIPHAKLRKGQSFIFYGDEICEPGEKASSSTNLFVGDKCYDIIYEFTALRREYNGYWHVPGEPAWFCRIDTVKVEL